jgi:uncharacterized membrane protein
MKNESWNDSKMGQIIGNLLRTGILLATITVFVGGVLYLFRFGRTQPELSIFHSEPSNLCCVRGIFERSLTWSSRGLIQLGLLILIATPIARVAFSLIGFLLEKDWIYTVITLMVLGILIFSLTSGCLNL